MGNAEAFQAIEYEQETSAALWAENVSTFATHRLPAIGKVDMSGLVHNKEIAGHVEQYRGAGSVPVLMDQGGSFKIILDLPGHGATTAGTPSLDAIETFLGKMFGIADLSLATSQTLSGGSVTAPTTSGATGVAAGGLVVIGALGDGDGDGQMYPVGTHSASTLNLLAALRGTPVNGAVLYPCAEMYLPSAPTTTDVVGLRFQILTANICYRAHGCFPMAVSLRGLAPRGRPQIEVTIGVSRWTETASGTFPSTVASNRYNPAVVAAGSLHVNTVGTATRNELVVRDFQIDWTIGIQPQYGSGGVGQYQTIVGAKRGEDEVKVSFVVDADATTGSPVIPGWGRDSLSRLMMYTLSTAIGSRVGLKLPKVCSTTVPVQMGDGGINRFRFEGIAYTGDTLTSELTRSRMVMGFA